MGYETQGIHAFLCIECLQRAKIKVDDGQIISVFCERCGIAVDDEDTGAMLSDLIQRECARPSSRLVSIEIVSESIGGIPVAADTGRSWPFDILGNDTEL